MTNEIKLPTLKCLRCGHSWIPRRPVLPKNCPKCTSRYWNIPKWRGVGKTSGKGISLTSTHSYYKGTADTIKLPILKCLRCGHEWIPRQLKKPKYCASCNSPCWNKPKVKQSGLNKESIPKAELCANTKQTKRRRLFGIASSASLWLNLA
jgi:predicted Zn-ribbon and HTH transcriptional regulator